MLLVLVFFFLGPQSSAQSTQIQSGFERLSPRFSPFTREFYLGYSTDQGFLAFILLTSLIGVRSISGDKAVNALEIYWTRGITPWSARADLLRRLGRFEEAKVAYQKALALSENVLERAFLERRLSEAASSESALGR